MKNAKKCSARVDYLGRYLGYQVSDQHAKARMCGEMRGLAYVMSLDERCVVPVAHPEISKRGAEQNCSDTYSVQ